MTIVRRRGALYAERVEDVPSPIPAAPPLLTRLGDAPG